MLRQNRARRSVVFADVLEDGVVAVLLGMMIDHEIDPVEARKIVGLHVDHADAIEFFDGVLGDRLDVNIEQVRHAHVFGAGHALERRNDGRGSRAVQHGSQRQATGHRVGVGLVVQQNEDAIGIGEVALILLHAGARQGAAEFGKKRRFE